MNWRRAASCRIVDVARFEFHQDPPPLEGMDKAERMLNLVVRSFGLVLMVVGLIVALTVIFSAWSLYRSPTHIESFAQAVEQGSHLDLTLSRATQNGQQQLDTSDRAGLAPPARTADTPDKTPPASFRFSYFMAWLIAILLLLLVGRLAIAAVRTGGELALYDVQVKKLARALLEERTRTKGE
ncbi:MAG: hypothetical protein IT492_05645 [Gammaproteobacteria bacterium]|nr:hypothetical protein [Gammaproteobacteria bacterium]